MMDYGSRSSSNISHTLPLESYAKEKHIKSNHGKYLVVESVSEYIATALAIAHQPKVREMHSQEILSRRGLLASPEVLRQAAADWFGLMTAAVGNSSRLGYTAAGIP